MQSLDLALSPNPSLYNTPPKHHTHKDHSICYILFLSCKGFDLVLKSVSGECNAYLDPAGYIAVKRGGKTAMSYVKGARIIDDITPLHITLQVSLNCR